MSVQNVRNEIFIYYICDTLYYVIVIIFILLSIIFIVLRQLIRVISRAARYSRRRSPNIIASTLDLTGGQACRSIYNIITPRNTVAVNITISQIYDYSFVLWLIDSRYSRDSWMRSDADRPSLNRRDFIEIRVRGRSKYQIYSSRLTDDHYLSRDIWTRTHSDYFLIREQLLSHFKSAE